MSYFDPEKCLEQGKNYQYNNYIVSKTCCRVSLKKLKEASDINLKDPNPYNPLHAKGQLRFYQQRQECSHYRPFVQKSTEN